MEKDNKSHSLRSAWIEIGVTGRNNETQAEVALLTECVDRNMQLPLYA